MAAQDPIWSCAREDLVIADDQGHPDVFVWEHATRVANNAEWIASQADVPREKLDRTVLSAAALYHDVGWIVQLREGTIARDELLCKAASELQRDLAAGLIQKRLAKLLPRRTLQRAAECIRLFRRRDHDVPEARILSDADNLDHIGPLLLWQIVRWQGLGSRGVQAAIDIWQKRKQYRFWDAWIDEFCFDSARAVARQRLKQIDRYMALLDGQHRGDDLDPAAP